MKETWSPGETLKIIARCPICGEIRQVLVTDFTEDLAMNLDKIKAAEIAIQKEHHCSNEKLTAAGINDYGVMGKPSIIGYRYYGTSEIEYILTCPACSHATLAVKDTHTLTCTTCGTITTL